MSNAETALAALSEIALKHAEIEAEVLWFRDGGWSDAMGEALEAEEIAYYAEGLLDEGFGMDWALLSGASGLHVRLCFWQGAAPAPPTLPRGESLIQSGRVEGPESA